MKANIQDDKIPGAVIYRIGNADLVILPIPRKENGSRPFFPAKRPGLHHIAVKVQDLSRSRAFCEQHKVDFESDCFSSIYPGRSMMLNPEQFNGVPILLRDSIL